MRNYLLIFLIFSLSSSVTFSQGGFRGKKFAISYQPSYSFLSKQYFISKHVLFHNSLSVLYSPFKFLSFGVSGSYLKKEILDHKNYEYVDVNDQTIGFTVNYHRQIKHGFAPGGKYFGLRVDFGFQNGETLEMKPYSDCATCSDVEHVYYDDRERQQLIVFSLVMGRNLILKDKFLVGYGIQWGLASGDNQPWRYLAKPFFNLGIIF